MILEVIAQESRERVKREKEEISLMEMKIRAEKVNYLESFAFEKVLREDGFHFICEVKKASPSKGIIAEEFPYLKIAKEYESAKAACISVLTEPNYFMGSNQYLTEISKEVRVPILRKDFIVDEYQIYQAKAIGADCILLIAAILSFEDIKHYLHICETLGMSALVEAHDEDEVKVSIAAGARMIGINNRNLKNFEVDINNSMRLRKLIPEHIIVVAESGISHRKDIIKLEEMGICAVLIGESLMKSENKKKKLDELRGFSLGDIVDKN